MSDKNIPSTDWHVPPSEALLDELSREVDRNLKCVMEELIKDSFVIFEMEDDVGTFSVNFGLEHELSYKTTLDHLVDVTLTCNSHDSWHNELANELERLAKVLRGRGE